MGQSDDTCVTLVLDGVGTVASADGILQRLRAATARGLALAVDCTAIETADLSLVQMLIAARRTLQAAGRDVTVRASAGGPLETSLKAGGFLSPSDTCDFISFQA